MEPATPAETSAPIGVETTLPQTTSAVVKRGWPSSVAPTYIGLFLWVVFFDQLPAELLGRGGLVAAVAGAGVAGFLAFALMYYPTASRGFAAGLPLNGLAARTFGVRGSVWVPRLLLVAVEILWFAVAASYGAAFCLMGLVHLGLLSPSFLGTAAAGSASVPALFLVTAFLWAVFAALTGRYLVRVIAALMNVYPLLPALMLGAAVVAAFAGLPSGRGVVWPAGRPALGTPDGVAAILLAVQMVLGFFAASGLASADWGLALKGKADVRDGGFVAVGFASWIVATLAILTVSGTAGRYPADGSLDLNFPFPARTFHSCLVPLFGPRPAGLMLLGFGLAALAPGVFTAHRFSEGLHHLRPRLSRTMATMLGALLAWPLIATARVFQLFEVFSIAGALVAPAIGAVAADWLLSRQGETTRRVGYNPAGLIAWLAGAVVGFVPLYGLWARKPALEGFQPAVLFALVTGFVVYSVLTAVGMSSRDEVSVTS